MRSFKTSFNQKTVILFVKEALKYQFFLRYSAVTIMNCGFSKEGFLPRTGAWLFCFSSIVSLKHRSRPLGSCTSTFLNLCVVLLLDKIKILPIFVFVCFQKKLESQFCKAAHTLRPDVCFIQIVHDAIFSLRWRSPPRMSTKPRMTPTRPKGRPSHRRPTKTRF